MKIKDMFVKPVDRDLKGVIKVEQKDDANAFQELDEFVVTNELLKHFKAFYEAYKVGINNLTDKMGVWIKGYYGSGKSHFLKILSYLLENRVVNGREAISFFTETGKIHDNFLIADIERAGRISSDVILFNIDSKSAVNSKVDKNAILDVFLRVFNEYQGFCETDLRVADLERELTEKGKYEDFKKAFQGFKGETWEGARDGLIFCEEEGVAALTSISWSEQQARNWFQNLSREEYNISIEGFAKRVLDFCKKKGNDHHLIFLVDEIGQYIGDDTKLMLNLQTVAEELGSKCKGKAWIVVTSQEDISHLTGSEEKAKVKGDDFSKILARFDTRLSLSSANVGEVIRIRLLSKNNAGTQALQSLYQEKESVLKNLIVFNSPNITVEMKKYKDANEFAAVYPFIPYQFDLLRYVLKAIHDHGASGKHLSEGERSMLAMFREAAVSVMNKETGSLVSFDLFYSALHTFLDHSHSSVIIRAEEDETLTYFDVKVLKTLFMIKYVKEIHANVENLTTLLIDSIDIDRISLQKQVEESLKRLIGKTLIQKNGSIYTFLTNEEQDVNRAIEKMDVESGEVRQIIQDIIFTETDLLGNVKFAVSSNAHSQFGFNRYLDDTLYKSGTLQELSMYVVSANTQDDWNDGKLRTATQNDNKRLMILLGGESSYVKEIYEMQRIRNYLTRNSGAKGSTLSAIIVAKQAEVKEREDRIKELLRDALMYAEFYVGGDKLAISSQNPAERVKTALTELADRAYLKLSYMGRTTEASDIKMALRSQRQAGIDGDTGNENKNALDAVLSIVSDNTALSVRTTLKTLAEKLMKIPYGFTRTDVSWLVATLFSANKLTLKMHGEVLSCSPETYADVEKYLTKNEFADQLIIEIRAKVSQKQIGSVKTVIKDFFGQTPEGDEEDVLIKQFSSLAGLMLTDIRVKLETYKSEPLLPGKRKLDEALMLLTTAKNEADNSLQSVFFSYMDGGKDDFLDLGDDLGVVLGFFDGVQKDIFTKALDALKLYDDSTTYLSGISGLSETADQIRSIVEMDWPYNSFHNLPNLTKSITEVIEIKLQEKRLEICDIIEKDRNVVSEEFISKGLRESKATEVSIADHEFLKLGDKLTNAHSFSLVVSISVESSTLKNKWLGLINSYVSEAAAGSGTKVPERKIVSVNLSSLTSGEKTLLDDEDDIEDFLSSLKKKLLDELKKGDGIQILR